MTVEDVVSLLKAGVGETVILDQIDASGSRLSPSVEDLLKLKRAGASDRLLAALIAPASVQGDKAGASSSFRFYRETNDRGEEVLHITNLDESGRRIGGEVVDRTPPNQIRQRADDEGDPYGAGREPSEESDRTPVIVNVYPPSPEEPEGYAPALGPGYGPYLGYGGYGYGGHGLVAGYGPGRPYRCVRSPHGFPHAAGFDTGFFSRPRAFSSAPYRQGTATQRNAARFGHHH